MEVIVKKCFFFVNISINKQNSSKYLEGKVVESEILSKKNLYDCFV